MFAKWFRGLVNWSNRQGRPLRKGRRGSASFRPKIEQLEVRLVPTTLTIPTTLAAAQGNVVTVPVNVDSLNDPAHGHVGLTGGDFVIYYNPAIFSVSTTDVSLGTIVTNGSSAAGSGYSPSAPHGWNIATNASVAGDITIGLSNSSNGIITTSGSGTLVTINFHVNGNAPSGTSQLDLAADTQRAAPATSISDQNFNQYTLNPAPQDNVAQLNPFVYSGTDPDDGLVTVAGATQPTAINDAYSVTARAVSTDPVLAVASPGVLANDTDPQGLALSAVVVSNPTHGTLVLNSNGAFVYTPSFNFIGADSFTYQATDGVNLSGIATVNLTVTARLSIPTNLTAALGGTVVVPVNVDNPDPAGSGGLDGVALAIDFDPTVFNTSASSITLGTVTDATNAVQTISFVGTVTGGSFLLMFNNTLNPYGGSVNGTTGAIAYSANSSTLAANVQTALDSLTGVGNTLVSAASATSVTVAFQGQLGGSAEPNLVAVSLLTGTQPTIAVGTTTAGFQAWTLVDNVGTGANLGQIGIAISSGFPDTNTIGGSLCLITFSVAANAPGGPSAIKHSGHQCAEGTISVTTRLDNASAQIPLRPVPTNSPNDAAVDGIVSILAPHLGVTAPSSVTAGSGF